MIRCIHRLLINRPVFWIYFTAILLLVALPLNRAGVAELNNITIVRIRADYLFHALAFMPWAFFMPVFKHKTITWLLFGLLFATSTETLQHLLPYRAYNINDLLANNIGIIASTLLRQTTKAKSPKNQVPSKKSQVKRTK